MAAALLNFDTERYLRIQSGALGLEAVRLARSLMTRRGEVGEYDEVLAEPRTRPRLLVDAKAASEPRARESAEAIASADWHSVTSAGNTWPEASYYGMCILEE